MPRIQTIQQDSNIRTGPVAGYVDDRAFTGFGIQEGRAMQAGLQDVANTLLKIQDQNERVWVNNTVTQARYTWQKNLEDRMNSAEPGAPGFTKTLANDWNKYVTDTLNKANVSNSSREVLLSHLNDLGLTLQGQSMRFEADQRLAKITDDTATAIDTTGAILLRDPSQFDKLYNEQLSNVNALEGRVRPDQFLRLRRAVKEVAISALEGYALEDPKKALALIQSGKFDGKIDATKLGGMMQHLKTQAEAQDMEKILSLGRTFDSNIAQIEETGEPITGFDPEQYYQAFGKKARVDVERQKGQSEIVMAQAMYQAKSEMAGKTPAEISKIIEKYTPTQDDPARKDKNEFLKRLSIYAAREVQAQQEDPNGYTRKTNKEIQASYENANQAYDAARSQGTDTKVAQDLMTQAIQHSQAYQTRMGVLPGEQQVISKSEAMTYSRLLTEQPPDQAQSFLVDLQQRYGQNYGGVIRAMQSLKPEEGRLDPRMELLALNIGQPFSGTLLEALRQKPSALDAVFKGDSDKAQFVKTLYGHSVATNLRNAMSSTSVSRGEYYNSLMQGVEAYGKALLLQGRANNPNDAANKAITILVDRVYDFETTNDKVYAIPRFYSSGAPYSKDDLARIRLNLGNKLSYYGRNPGQLDLTQFKGFGENTTDETKGEIIGSNLKRKAFWATSPDNRSAELWIDLDGQGALTRVKDKYGRPIVQDFDKMATQIVSK